MLRKEMENLFELYGDDCLKMKSFIDDHSSLYWNLVGTCIMFPLSLIIFTPFLWNGVYAMMLAGILIMPIIRFLLNMYIIHMFMHTSVMKCTIMYYELTA